MGKADGAFYRFESPGFQEPVHQCIQQYIHKRNARQIKKLPRRVGLPNGIDEVYSIDNR